MRGRKHAIRCCVAGQRPFWQLTVNPFPPRIELMQSKKWANLVENISCRIVDGLFRRVDRDGGPVFCSERFGFLLCLVDNPRLRGQCRTVQRVASE